MVRSSLAALVGICLVLGLAGCATPQDQPGDISSLFATDEQRASLAACLQERGWTVDYDADSGQILTEVPDAQESVFVKDQAECTELSGVNVDQPLTAEQLDVVFDWYVKIADCLEENGWEVPTTPSRTTFRESYDTDPWIPWILVPGEEMSRAKELCPDLTFGGRAG